MYVANNETKLKKNSIIWSYEDGPVRVEENNPLLKIYSYICEPSASQKAWQSLLFAPPLSLRGLSYGKPVAISLGLLRRFAPRNDN